MDWNYEQEYKNAFGRARSAYGTGAYDDATMEFIFPQITDSEDERIRKALIGHLKVGVDFVSNGVTKAECIAWLEKQKEQKKSLSERFRPDFPAVADFIESVDELEKNWKPSEDEERLIKTSISFLKDFADKGYENAVECIDWLKSKLNGNSGK